MGYASGALVGGNGAVLVGARGPSIQLQRVEERWEAGWDCDLEGD